MGRALHGFQIRLEHGVVDGGGDLADAAAHLGLGLAAGDVGNGLQIALFLGALAYDLVEGEDVAGHQDGAVDLLAGQLQVVGAVVDGGVLRVGLGQGVLEQAVLQLLCRELGMGDEDGGPELGAFAGGLQRGGQGFAVEGVAVFPFLHLAGGLDELRLHRVLAVALVELVHVHGLGDVKLIGEGGLQDLLRLFGDQRQRPGVRDGFAEVLGGEAAARHAGADQHNVLRQIALGVGVGILRLAQLVGGGLVGGAGFLREGLHRGLQGLVVPDQIVPRVHQIAVAAGTLLAFAGVQIGLQLVELQAHAGVGLLQSQDEGLLAVPLLDGSGIQRQGQIALQHLVQLGEPLLHVSPGHALQGHRGGRSHGGRCDHGLGLSGLGPPGLGVDQDPHHQNRHAGHCGQNGPELAFGRWRRLLFGLIQHSVGIGTARRTRRTFPRFKFSFCQRCFPLSVRLLS